MCDDYDLCEECERRPRDEVHDMEHLFIKLKTRQNGKWKNRSPALDKVRRVIEGCWEINQNFVHLRDTWHSICEITK